MGLSAEDRRRIVEEEKARFAAHERLKKEAETKKAEKGGGGLTAGCVGCGGCLISLFVLCAVGLTVISLLSPSTPGAPPAGAASRSLQSAENKVEVYPVPFQPKSGPPMSRGLGLTLRELEAVYGPAETNSVDTYFFRSRTLQYMPEPGWFKSSLLWDWEHTGLVSLEEARERARTLMPADARFVCSRPGAEEGQVVDVYKSRWLRSRFRSTDSPQFVTFAVLYTRFPGERFFGCDIGEEDDMLR